MPKIDQARIRHMLDAAREAANFARDRSRSDLDKNLVWTLGLVKCVEIIGEAASRVGKDDEGEDILRFLGRRSLP